MAHQGTAGQRKDTGGKPGLTRGETAPTRLMNGHFAAVGEDGTAEQFSRGVQVVDEDKQFNQNLSKYLAVEHVLPVGFNYHVISVFGSQSTGKSTLLNYLFGTEFGVMKEEERQQTTKGIWMSKNKREGSGMAQNILVMDVEGTDGRERGEDQDFERKSSLFALATSEVLMVNIWEHQVGLYQGANMGLLKTVFEVNLQLFFQDSNSIPRSLLFFVIRDHIGNTPLINLRNTLLADLERLWSSISKPQGLEKSRISDYFDFEFVALPHKILQPEKFESEVKKLGLRFKEAPGDSKRKGLVQSDDAGIFLPAYHRRIPADGFPMYADGIWEQIVHNKDLDLPTQQELLAQFRCDEIAREVMVAFDEVVQPLEEEQAANSRMGASVVLESLGVTINKARIQALSAFKDNASRYHQGVYQQKGSELVSNIDARLKVLYQGQLDAIKKLSLTNFGDEVTAAVKNGQRSGVAYDFAQIVDAAKRKAVAAFERAAQASAVKDASWSNHTQQLQTFTKDLDEASRQLRKDELRRLTIRIERWIKSRLGESLGLEFNKLGTKPTGYGHADDAGTTTAEGDIWDRVWNVFTKTVSEAQQRFADRAKSFDASPEEVNVGLWKLRRKSWGVLRAKLDEEMMEGNLLLKLRENFEDGFRYDRDGVPRIWRPTDDIEGAYTKAREHTLSLIPLLTRFRISETGQPPPLDTWIGKTPENISAADEDDVPPIGGVDEDEGKSLEEETLILTEAKAADLANRFRKMADGVFVEAKRGALGGITQVPWYFYGLLLVLGWNEILAVLRNPLFFVLLILLGSGAYVTYTLNLWGPMLRMSQAAADQALVIGKEKLREFLENTETGRQAMAMSGREEVPLSTLKPRRREVDADDDADDGLDI